MFDRFGTHVDIPGVRVGFSGAHFVIFVCFGIIVFSVFPYLFWVVVRLFKCSKVNISVNASLGSHFCFGSGHGVFLLFVGRAGVSRLIGALCSLLVLRVGLSGILVDRLSLCVGTWLHIRSNKRPIASS